MERKQEDLHILKWRNENSALVMQDGYLFIMCVGSFFCLFVFFGPLISFSLYRTLTFDVVLLQLQ